MNIDAYDDALLMVCRDKKNGNVSYNANVAHDCIMAL